MSLLANPTVQSLPEVPVNLHWYNDLCGIESHSVGCLPGNDRRRKVAELLAADNITEVWYFVPGDFTAKFLKSTTPNV